MLDEAPAADPRPPKKHLQFHVPSPAVLSRYSLKLGNEDVLAVRIHAKRPKTGLSERFFHVDVPSFLAYLRVGGSPAFWMCKNNRMVCASVRLGDAIKAPIYGRFVINAGPGEGVHIGPNGPFDLRRSQLNKIKHRGAGSSVADVLAQSNRRPGFVDWSEHLIAPELLDMQTYTILP